MERTVLQRGRLEDIVEPVGPGPRQAKPLPEEASIFEPKTRECVHFVSSFSADGIEYPASCLTFYEAK